MAAQSARRIEPVTTRTEDLTIVPTQTPTLERSKRPRQAYRILQLGFTVAPIIAGADKFFHAMTDWNQYLAPIVPRLTGIPADTFMRGVGVIEIAAGVGVAVKPKIFSYVVSGWLGGIVINLLMTGRYYDIALRDVGLSLGALALGRLSHDAEKKSAAST